MDRYQTNAYAMEVNLIGSLQPIPFRRTSERRGVIRVIKPNVPPAIIEFRKSFDAQVLPLTGFRAPILSKLDGYWPSRKSIESSSTTELMKLIDEKLGAEGLTKTLVLSCEWIYRTHPELQLSLVLKELRNSGFPIDLLSFIHFEASGLTLGTSKQLIEYIRHHLSNSKTTTEIIQQMEAAEFRFRQTSPGFRIATEAGERELKTVRVHLNGGLENNGFIPGSSLDVVGQLIEALPNSDFVASIQQEATPYIQMFAGRNWNLRRQNQLTMIAEPIPLSSWAQDNGKAGTIPMAGNTNRAMVMLPRYASLGEAVSYFLPGDSFLAEGLKTVGTFEVDQSPLLFQGGNLLAGKRAKDGVLKLFVSESTIYRNTALGLKYEEVVEMFRIEFGVDEVIVVPTVSYHLDYDVSFRTVDGKLVAFVNEPIAAAKAIIMAAMPILVSHPMLNTNQISSISAHWDSSNPTTTIRELRTIIEATRNEGKFPKAFVARFEKGNSDLPSPNFESFMLSLDILEASDSAATNIATGSRAEYLQLLKSTLQNMKIQYEVLEKEVDEVVKIPSMPELRRGLNYINSIQTPESVLMPAWGGLYDSVDKLAAETFTKRLGAKIKVVPIHASDSLLRQGGVHCAASVFPAAN